MAAIYRYGFEGGYVPSGVSFTGSYSIVSGRAGVSSSAARGNGTGQSYVEMVMKEATSEIYATFYTRVDSVGSGAETTIFQFGPSEITYTPSTQTIALKSNGVVLNSVVQSLPNGTFIPFSAHSLLSDSTGYLDIRVENFSASFSGNTLQGSSVIFPDKLKLGLGSTTTTAKFTLDDIAVNDTHSYTNGTGSYGVGSITSPPFITATRTTISSSALNEWLPLDPYMGTNVIDIVNGVADSYIKALQYNETTQFILTPIVSGSITSLEGINLYFKSFVAQEDTPVYLYGYLQLSGSASINQAQSKRLSGIESSNGMSILEKELGGKLTIDDVNQSYLTISPKRFINQNYFGLGASGDALYTSSAIIGGSSDDFEFLDYNNLTIASGAFVTTSVKKRGLVIYVRENCIIEGTLSMDGRGHSGSLSNDTGSSIWKNTSSLLIVESASLSIDSTWYYEQTYQPYKAGTSSLFGIFTYTSPNQSGLLGGGGSGGNATGFGGVGSSSSLWGGGTGGGGAADVVGGGDAGQYADSGGSGGSHFLGYPTNGGNGASNPGGTIYLFVGKNLIFGSTGMISATGSNGSNGTSAGSREAGGGGGAGGGCAKIFYGLNFYNLGGTVLVNGGVGGSGINGGQNGQSGGSGSYEIVKLLTN